MSDSENADKFNAVKPGVNVLKAVMGIEAQLGGFNPAETPLPPGHPLLQANRPAPNLPESHKKPSAEKEKKQDDDESITVIKNRIAKINGELEKVMLSIVAQSEELNEVFDKLTEFPSVFAKAKRLKQVLINCHAVLRSSLVKPYLGK